MQPNKVFTGTKFDDSYKKSYQITAWQYDANTLPIDDPQEIQAIKLLSLSLLHLLHLVASFVVFKQIPYAFLMVKLAFS